ncbi:MAG: hypothetical protein Roseis2KO_13480 [Roseivirga sp.]
MLSETRSLTFLVFILLTVAISCKSTDKTKKQSATEADTEEKILSPADLAQLRDTHKLNPDAAIVSGKVVELVQGSKSDFVLEVDKLEKKGFGFSNQLRSGDKLTVVAGNKAGDLTQGQSVLIVISASKRPGAADQYILEKVLAAMPGK